MKNKMIVVAVIAAIVVVGVVGAIALTGKDKSSTNSSMAGMDKHPTTTSDNSTATSGSKAVAATKVTITNYSFSPQTIKVKVGDTVTWTNQDSVKHTVTADSASADAPNSELFGDGETYSFTFKKAGTYAYHCAPHPYMKGTVIVE